MRDNGDRAYGTIVKPRRRLQAPCLILNNHRTPVRFYVRPESQFKYKEYLQDHGRVPLLRGFAGKFLLATFRVWTEARG